MSTTSCGINENGTLTKDRAKIGHIGDIIAFYGSTAPEGTLVCNGAAISRTTYSELFGVIGTTAGAGDGSTTFNLPDLRGLFLRGLNGANAAALGVEQGDAMRKIEGETGGNNSYIFRDRDTTGVCEAIGTYGTPEEEGNDEHIGHYPTIENTTNDLLFNRWKLHIDSSRTIPTAAENRPVNTAVLYCMIYE